MKKLMFIVIVLCLVSSIFIGCSNDANVEDTNAEDVVSTELPSENEKTVIIDSAGRTVELDKDINKVSLMNTGSLEIMRALGIIDKISSVPSIVPKNPEYYPEEYLQNLPQVSNADGISYEAIIEMNPDLIITYANERYCDLDELEEKLSSTDIKIVALNFYNPEIVVDEIRIMGEIFNLEEKANGLADLMQNNLDIVNERVSKIKEEDKVTVYYERFMGDYKSAASGSGYHDLIVMAGGKNIFEDSESPYPTVSAEEVLVKNPDVIIKGDSESETIEDMQAYVDLLASRPGWSDLDSVKNNNVHVISSSLVTDGCRKPIAVCYFAKALYPELFSDLDIEAFERAFFDYQKPGELNTFMYPEK